MKRWKCKKCGGYIKVSVENILVGSSVVFGLYKDGLCNSECKYLHAVVLESGDDFFYLVSYGDFYKIRKIFVYPEDAPVPFIYNMFWLCFC